MSPPLGLSAIRKYFAYLNLTDHGLIRSCGGLSLSLRSWLSGCFCGRFDQSVRMYVFFIVCGKWQQLDLTTIWFAFSAGFYSRPDTLVVASGNNVRDVGDYFACAFGILHRILALKLSTVNGMTSKLLIFSLCPLLWQGHIPALFARRQHYRFQQIDLLGFFWLHFRFIVVRPSDLFGKLNDFVCVRPL